MKNRINFLVVGLCVLMFSLTTDVAEAYRSTDQSVVRLNDDTVLFRIDFDFGFLNADAWLPYMTARDGSSSARALHFRLLDEAGMEVSGGVAYGVVLGDTDIIRDGRYYIPRGERESFSLVVAVRLTPEVADAVGALRLETTALPYTILREGEMSDRYLGPADLTTHRTPAILLAPISISAVPNK